MFKLLPYLGILVLLTTSCSMFNNMPSCYDENSKYFLKWGQLYKGEDRIHAHLIRYDNKVFRLNKFDDTTGIYLGRLNEEDFCEVSSLVMQQISNSQALNVPADVNDFLEYTIPDKNVRFLARWVAKHDNQGNRGFKFLKSQLDSLLAKVELEQ